MTAALAALVCALAAPALASAAGTLVVAPGAAREVEPCTTATPCNYLWAIEHATSGESVQFESGLYAFDGAALKTNVVVPAGVTLEPAPGDATRPVIRQTTPYKAGFSAPMFALEANVTIRDLEIDQTATTVNNGAGALDANQGDVIERTILTGGLGGMYATPNAPGTIAMRNDLVIAGGGVAIQLENGTMSLDNVTAIARGSESGTGVALLSHSTFNKASTIEATNTIARGQRYDAEASIESSGSGSTIVFHYSDARTAFELAQGSPTKVEDTDHPTHGEPAFAAAGDYHEALGSPTIDAGKPDAASGSIDLDGFARTVGAGTDIGAYELQKPRHRSSCRCHPCRSWCPSCRRRLHSPGWHSPRLASGRRPRAPRFHGIAPRSERRSPIATPRRRPRRSRSRSPSPGFAAGAPASHPRMGIDPAITAGRAAAT